MGVVNIILLLITAAVVSCKEYVPVLIWSTSEVQDSYPVVPALSKLTTNEFTDYLLKRVKAEKPMILVFMEENLSTEDFSWRDVNENGAFPHLSNITKLTDDVAFLPSVHDPYRGVKKLRNHGYSWKIYEKEGFDSLKDEKNTIFEIKLDEPDYLEDRPDMLKRHDEQVAKLYNEALKYNSNVMVVYSGSHTSWIDADLDRSKREDKEAAVSDTITISDEKNIIRIAASLPIMYLKENSSIVNIIKVIGTPTISNSSENSSLSVRFFIDANKEINVWFVFSIKEGDWWSLKGAEIRETKVFLKPSVNIEAPSGHSYFCNPTVTFSGNNISLIFENLQVQPTGGQGNGFGPVIHCIPFFSIGIWSGLVVVFILSIVLAWGITMIMDINTNDRFDDPKGKTITISSSE